MCYEMFYDGFSPPDVLHKSFNGFKSKENQKDSMAAIVHSLFICTK